MPFRFFLSIFLLIALVFPVHAGEKESAYNRVMKTGTIRCGYWSWEPLFKVDANTHKMSGIFKDVMEEIARLSELKVEWTREVTFADLVSDLNSGKIDALCAGVWPSPIRAKYIEFSTPLFFIPMNAYKRAGDQRFDNKKQNINSSSVTIAVMDGEMSTEIRNTEFPQSKALLVPQMAGSATDLLMNVITSKADLTFTDSISGISGSQFMIANPKSVVPVHFDIPLRLMPNAMAVAGGENRLNYFLSESIRQLHNNGVIEKILQRYEAKYPERSFIRVAKSYEALK